MDIEKFKEQSSDIMKNGIEATKKMDAESATFVGKIPEYVLDSTDLILYTSIMTLPPTVMARISKMLLAHCDHLYMVGFLHGMEKGRVEQGEECEKQRILEKLLNDNIDILQN